VDGYHEIGSSVSLRSRSQPEWWLKRERFLARCDNHFRQRKPINNLAACLSPAILSSEFPSILGVGNVGGGTSQDPWIVNTMKRRITTMLLIISTLSLLYRMLLFICSTFIHISFSHSFNFSYLSLAAFLNHDKKAPPFSSSSFFQHQEKRTIYPRWGPRWRSQHDTRQWQWSSRWHFRIRRRACSATIEECNRQVAIKRFLHVKIWRMSHSNSINSYVGATPTSWASAGLYCLGGGGRTRACATGIQDGIQSSVWMIESAH